MAAKRSATKLGPKLLVGVIFAAAMLAIIMRGKPPEPSPASSRSAQLAPHNSQPITPTAAAAIAAVPAPQRSETEARHAPSPAAIPPPAVLDPPAPPASPIAGRLQPSSLLIPVPGVKREQLVDTFSQTREGTRPHEALDIPAARGTPVLAVADGKVVKLFNSKPGGLTVYQFDPSEKYAYYYAHLDHYASGLAEGQVLKRGEVLGYVGSTGNASPAAPHLHFAIFELGPEKHWWQGTAINPYPILTAR